MDAGIRVWAVAFILGIGSFGCAGVGQVRYVYQDGESGVIGLPENNSHWPTYYRQHAEELMAKHFPEGYEIVRAEEVEEGSRTLTINGSRAVELDPEVSGRIVALGKLGRTSSRSETNTSKLKECRIIYKKAEPRGAQKSGDYAEQAAWTPTRYVDPNASARASGAVKAPIAKAPEPPAPGASSPPTPEGHGQGETSPANAPPLLLETQHARACGPPPFAVKRSGRD